MLQLNYTTGRFVMVTSKANKYFTPINGNAARVVLSKGTHFTPKKELKNVYKDPLYFRKSDHTAMGDERKLYNEMVGKKNGRITVLGKDLNTKKNCNGSMWVCKCVCGNFLLLRSKGIKKGKMQDRCNECLYIQELRNR